MSGRIYKPTIHTASPETQMYTVSIAPTNPASAAWPTANKGVFIPFSIAGTYLVNFVFWCNGNAAGNGTADVGVYDTADPPNLLLSCGPTTTAGALVAQSVALATPVTLNPGSYYFAMSMSSTSDFVLRWTMSQARYGNLIGTAEQASIGTLPSTATLATSNTLAIYPLFGIGNAPVI